MLIFVMKRPTSAFFLQKALPMYIDSVFKQHFIKFHKMHALEGLAKRMERTSLIFGAFCMYVKLTYRHTKRDWVVLLFQLMPNIHPDAFLHGSWSWFHLRQLWLPETHLQPSLYLSWSVEWKRRQPLSFQSSNIIACNCRIQEYCWIVIPR